MVSHAPMHKRVRRVKNPRDHRKQPHFDVTGIVPCILRPCRGTPAPLPNAPSPPTGATGMPTVCGNSTVIVGDGELRRNRRAERRQGPRFFYRPRGKQQHIVATLVCNPSIYDGDRIWEPLFAARAGSPETQGSLGYYQQMVDSVFSPQAGAAPISQAPFSTGQRRLAVPVMFGASATGPLEIVTGWRVADFSCDDQLVTSASASAAARQP